MCRIAVGIRSSPARRVETRRGLANAMAGVMGYPRSFFRSLAAGLRGALALAFSLVLRLGAGAQEPDTLRATLLPPPTGVQSGALLGFSVAADGGYVVAGARFDSGGPGGTGAVKVFDATAGVRLFMLRRPAGNEGEYFGWSVAISGTLLVVGAPYDDVGMRTDAGRVYVYDLAGATPTVPMMTLNNPAPNQSDHFGWAVGISGLRVVVGAPDYGQCVGRAYVYDLAGVTPTVHVATLNNPSPVTYEYFGQAVGISGSRVVIGAPYDSAGAANAGSAYVYDVAGASPGVPVLTLNNPEPTAGDNFAAAVAISGTRMVIGTPHDVAGTGESGTAYVYDVVGASPAIPVASLYNPTPAYGDGFGNKIGRAHV